MAAASPVKVTSCNALPKSVAKGTSSSASCILAQTAGRVAATRAPSPAVIAASKAWKVATRSHTPPEAAGSRSV